MSQALAPARWMLGLAAVGLVAAGAIGGGLITRQVGAQAQTEEAQTPPPVEKKQASTDEAGPRRESREARTVRETSETRDAQVCASCGVVESVQAQARKGDSSGVGAVAGGVIGGLIGNQMGGGNGKKAMTVVGAVGGGLAGNEIEKQRNATTVYLTQVRMDDGSLRSFTRSTQLNVGQRVRVEDQKLILQ